MLPPRPGTPPLAYASNVFRIVLAAALLLQTRNTNDPFSLLISFLPSQIVLVEVTDRWDGILEKTAKWYLPFQAMLLIMSQSPMTVPCAIVRLVLGIAFPTQQNERLLSVMALVAADVGAVVSGLSFDSRAMHTLAIWAITVAACEISHLPVLRTTRHSLFVPLVCLVTGIMSILSLDIFVAAADQSFVHRAIDGYVIGVMDIMGVETDWWKALALALLIVASYYATRPEYSSTTATIPAPHLHSDNSFVERARKQDLLTFVASMSFVHMLLVLYLTSTDQLHLAVVNIFVVASLLFRNHSEISLHSLITGVLFTQCISLMYRGKGDAFELEQIGLVYCSIRLVVGAVSTESFSRLAAHTLLLNSVAIWFASSGGLRYLCFVVTWMAIFAGRIRAAAWKVAEGWLKSEAEMRRLLDHELKVSFSGITLALELCLSEENTAHLSQDTINMLREALAECTRGKELCYESALQRVVYEDTFEVRVEGRVVDDVMQASWASVMHEVSREDGRKYVYTDWNLVHHIVDNAIANCNKYGSRAHPIMLKFHIIDDEAIPIAPPSATGGGTTTTTTASTDISPFPHQTTTQHVRSRRGRRTPGSGGGTGSDSGTNPTSNISGGSSSNVANTPAARTAKLRITIASVPVQDERYRQVLNLASTEELFEYKPPVVSSVSDTTHKLGAAKSSTQLGLPVAKIFATRLNGSVWLEALPELTTFGMEIPVTYLMREPEPRPTQSSSSHGSGVSHGNATSSSDMEGSSIVPVHTGGEGMGTSGAQRIPANLVFAFLDDSAMIRTTATLTLKRDFHASPESFVMGESPEDIDLFPQRIMSKKVDVVVVDENLDYDDLDSATTGTQVARRLRNELGYEGVIILYSANDENEKQWDPSLDGFMSKSASRATTKEVVTQIYFRAKASRASMASLAAGGGGGGGAGRGAGGGAAPKTGESRTGSPSSRLAGGSSGGGSTIIHPTHSRHVPTAAHESESASPVVSGESSLTSEHAPATEVSVAWLSPRLAQSPLGPAYLKILSSKFTRVERSDRYLFGMTIAVMEASEIKLAKSVHAIDPYVTVAGLLTSPSVLPKGSTGIDYSPILRVAVGCAISDLTPSKDDLELNCVAFDVLVRKPLDLDKLDAPLFVRVKSLHLLPRSRFFSDLLNQEISERVFNEFADFDKESSIMDVMATTLLDGLKRISKRPTRDGIRRVAHATKGSGAQVGVMALKDAATKLEAVCSEDANSSLEDVMAALIPFYALSMSFLVEYKVFKRLE